MRSTIGFSRNIIMLFVFLILMGTVATFLSAPYLVLRSHEAPLTIYCFLIVSFILLPLMILSSLLNIRKNKKYLENLQRYNVPLHDFAITTKIMLSNESIIRLLHSVPSGEEWRVALLVFEETRVITTLVPQYIDRERAAETKKFCESIDREVMRSLWKKTSRQNYIH